MAQPIQGLSIGLGLDTSGLDIGLKRARSEIKAVSSEMASNMSAFDRGERSVQKYQTQITGLNRKLEAQKNVTSAARVEYERMVAQHGEGSNQAVRAATAYNREVAALNNLERHVEGVSEELREFQNQQRLAQSGWTRMGESMTFAGQTLAKVGGSMKTVGKSMSTYITAPLVAMGAGAIKAAVDFESSFAGVRKTVNTSEAGFLALEEGIRDMAKELPVSANAIAEVAESAGQLGIAEENILGFTRTIIDMGESTNLSLDQASSEMARFANITGMSQGDFDRLGSSLVNLGNNLATTESEIMSMGMRLAGTGAQVGLTEAEIMALAASMSSVGIEAEAGGTAMSTVMKKIQNAVSEGGGALNTFAKAADMSSSDFAKAFEERPIEAIDAFIKGLAKSSGEGENLNNILEDLGIKGIRESDTLLRLAGASDILSTAVGLSSTAWEENTALSDEAAQRYETMAAKMQMLKNQFMDIAIDMGNILMPHFIKLTDHISSAVEWFGNLSDSTKSNIVTFAGVAAVLGPVILGIGHLATGLAGVLAVAGPLVTAIGGAGGLSASLGIAGSAIAAFATGPVGVAIAAITGIAAATGIVVNHMRKDAIPEIDRFGDEVSETTKEALGSFFELSDGVSEAMMDLKINAGIVTDELAADMTGKFSEMNNQILEGMKTRHATQLESTRQFFADSSVLTEEEEASILKQQEWANEMQIASQEAKEARVNEIWAKASAEKRKVTETEQIEIDAIRATMNETAVRELSANEVEQAIIMQRMKDTAGALSAQQAAEVVKRSAEQRDGTIANAEQEYEDRVAEIIRLRDESGKISEEQATQMIAEARKTRDETVGYAESMHDDIVGEAKQQAKEHVNEVDWSTGEILTKWQYHTKRVKQNFQDFKDNTLRDFKAFGEGFGNFMDSMMDGVKRWGSGVVSRFKTSSQDGVNAIGKMVNGAINGINWALTKLGISNIPRWNIPTLFNTSSAGGGSGGNRNSVVAYADGTNHHPGGLAVVGDGKGSNAGRELIHTPDGKFTLSPSKDTLVDLPRGSSVLSARETKQLFKGVPMYANGIGNIFAGIKKFGTAAVNKGFDIWNYITNPSKLLDLAFKAFGVGPPTGGLGTFAADLARGGFNKIKEGAIGFLAKQLKKYEEENGGVGPGFGPPFRLTSRRGWRIHPITGKRTFHQGDDWGAPQGTRIPSQSGGTVSATGYQSARGNFIRVKSGIYEHLYQHNLRNSLKRGDQVRRGQTVGLVGSTGMSTGPHLHHELKKNGVNINPSGLETGGIVTSEQLVRIGEKNRQEVVIPLHPSRRTDAMKLLALAGKRLMAADKGVIRPNQLPNVQGGSGTLEKLLEATMRSMDMMAEQNQILMQLLRKDGNVYLDKHQLVGSITPDISKELSRDLKTKRSMIGY